MKFSVIIPTYYNPEKIQRCIEALEKQTYMPQEAIVVYSSCDNATKERLTRLKEKISLKVKALPVKEMSRMSVVLNAGIKKSLGDVVCFLDEDVIPDRKWLSGIKDCLMDSDVAACGGKDIIILKGRKRQFKETDKVGIIKWKGYIVGNQNRGRVKKEVMFLKGCNMAVKKEYLKMLDENLLGLVRWEQDIFFYISKLKAKVIYDPRLIVFHLKDKLQYSAPRRGYWYGHNTVYLFMKYSNGIEKFLANLFYFFIGDASAPGFFRFLPYILQTGENGLFSFAVAQIGKIKGFLFYFIKR